MKILFAALHQGYYRNLDSVVEELARRGHDVHLASERPDSAFGGQVLLDRLVANHPNLTAGRIPPREAESFSLASRIRLAHDYLRYLEPMYSGSSGLRPRAKVRTPVGMVRLSEAALESRPWARRLVASLLDAIDRAVPPSPAIEAYLDAQRPDLIVITPLIGLGGSQLDVLRSAQARRIPTAVFVWSWDHLSSKGVIRDCPDGLFVWNDAQKREATGMHRVPAERVVVTGAQCYDRWFGRTPSRGRAEFIRHAGLPDDRPYVLWVCSALLPGSPLEPDVVMRWARHLRACSEPRVRDASILIRPHPSRLEQWAGVDWQSLGNVALCGQSPIDDDSRAEYFDSLYHSAAVVGVTTSAFIEAAIVGRPVMTICSDDLKQEHEGSLHFQHLLTVGGGLMTTARTLDEHTRQLAAMLDGPPTAVLERQRRFVEAFVRPHGFDVSATDIAVDALERLSPVGRALSGSSALGRLGLRALEAVERHPRWRYLLLSEREQAGAARQDEKARLREEALARKKQQREEKARRAALRSRGA